MEGQGYRDNVTDNAWDLGYHDGKKSHHEPEQVSTKLRINYCAGYHEGLRDEHKINPKVYEWCDGHNVWWVDCVECYHEELTMKAAIRKTKIDDIGNKEHHEQATLRSDHLGRTITIQRAAPNRSPDRTRE